MSSVPVSSLKLGDIVRIAEWTEAKPNVQTVLVKVVRVVLPELILVKYVKVWTSEKMQRGEGRISSYDIKKYEVVTEEQFEMMWNLATHNG